VQLNKGVIFIAMKSFFNKFSIHSKGYKGQSLLEYGLVLALVSVVTVVVLKIVGG